MNGIIKSNFSTTKITTQMHCWERELIMVTVLTRMATACDVMLFVYPQVSIKRFPKEI